MPEKPTTKTTQKKQAGNVPASTNGNREYRPLWERYHRRRDQDVSVKIDEPVRNMIEDWSKFVTEQVGFQVTFDMSIEDICKEYLFSHPDFQKWLQSKPKDATNSVVAKSGEN